MFDGAGLWIGVEEEEEEDEDERAALADSGGQCTWTFAQRPAVATL